MTEDRDFKKLVRQRAAKTGESYQAARRQLEKRVRDANSRARIDNLFRTPRGVVIGCTVERGTITQGSTALVLHGGRPIHEATILRIRNFRADIEAASAGRQCGLLLDPPYRGPLADEIVTVN